MSRESGSRAADSRGIVEESDAFFESLIAEAVGNGKWHDAADALDRKIQVHAQRGFPCWPDEATFREAVSAYASRMDEWAKKAASDGKIRAASYIKNKEMTRRKALNYDTRRDDLTASLRKNQKRDSIRIVPPGEPLTPDMKRIIGNDPTGWGLWTWNPHPRQREFLDLYYDHPEYLLVIGDTGERFGKTKALASIVARAVLGFDSTMPKGRPLNILLIIPTEAQGEGVIRKELEAFIPARLIRRATQDVIECEVNGIRTGTVYILSAAAGPVPIRGRNADLIVNEEEPGDNPNVWNEEMSRIVVGGGGGRIVIAFSPVRGATWSKEAIFELKAPWASPIFRGVTYDNAASVHMVEGVPHGGHGYLPDAKIAYMEDKCGGRGSAEWRRRMMGDLVPVQGLVWPGVSDRLHRLDSHEIIPRDEADSVLSAADFGTSAPTASLVGLLKLSHPTAADPPRLWVVDCYRSHRIVGGRTFSSEIEALADQYRRWQPDSLVIDPTPTMCDPETRATLLDRLNDAGLPYQAARKERQVGIRIVADWLATLSSDGRPRLLFVRNPDTDSLMREIAHYWYEDRGDSFGKPGGWRDAIPRRGKGLHAVDALRYLVMLAEEVVRNGPDSQMVRPVITDRKVDYGDVGSEKWCNAMAAGEDAEAGFADLSGRLDAVDFWS